MPRPKGLPKTGGRRKGSINKKTRAIADHARQEGLTPLEYLCGIVRDEKQPQAVRMQAAEKALPYMHPRLEMIAAMVDQRSTTDYEIKATLEERLAIAQELFDRAFGLMGKSRPHPQIIEVEAIQVPK